jgi:hypothetical protein
MNLARGARASEVHDQANRLLEFSRNDVAHVFIRKAMQLMSGTGHHSNKINVGHS